MTGRDWLSLMVRDFSCFYFHVVEVPLQYSWLKVFVPSHLSEPSEADRRKRAFSRMLLLFWRWCRGSILRDHQLTVIRENTENALLALKKKPSIWAESPALACWKSIWSSNRHQSSWVSFCTPLQFSTVCNVNIISSRPPLCPPPPPPCLLCNVLRSPRTPFLFRCIRHASKQKPTCE